jgi:hypothetical protein
MILRCVCAVFVFIISAAVSAIYDMITN